MFDAATPRASHRIATLCFAIALALGAFSSRSAQACSCLDWQSECACGKNPGLIIAQASLFTVTLLTAPLAATSYDWSPETQRACGRLGVAFAVFNFVLAPLWLITKHLGGLMIPHMLISAVDFGISLGALRNARRRLELRPHASADLNEGGFVIGLTFTW
jgi:hypothetical protein